MGEKPENTAVETETNPRQNEAIVMLHGEEVLRLDPNGDVVFQGNFILKDLEANKRFFKFFQDNLTRIIEGDEAGDAEIASSPDACGSCTGC